MENEVILVAEEGSYSPPVQLVEMFWWGLACILIISVGISVTLSVIKEIVRAIYPLPDKVESSMLRFLGI